MEAQTDAAAHVLCVVSEKYLKAPYSSLERQAAEWAAASRRPNFALPVYVEPCEAPILFGPLKRCDLHGITEDEARARLKAFLEPARKPPRGPFPGGVKSPTTPTPTRPPFPGNIALSNVPIRVPEHFLGRDDALAAIGTSLKRFEGRVAITAVHGLRGVGKTTLAAAYAEKHRGDYRATWWIRAQTEPTMRADLVALGVRLQWVGPDAKEEDALAAVTERLRNEGEGILLIYDNAIDAASLKPYLLPGGAAKVLVTSNAHAWRGVADPVELPVWPNDIGADYFIARTGREGERAAAETLSEALGGLPLAHEQAAAYCERLDIPLAEYQKRFEAAPARFLDDSRHAPAEYHDGLTVAKTFALAIDEAAKLHPAAEPLIVYGALLAPEPIPLYLFSEARQKFGEPLASALADDGLDETVAALRSFALVERETIPDERDPSITTECIRLHRLVRQVAAARREGAARNDVLRALVKAMAAVYPDDSYNSLLQVQGDYVRAQPLYERALAIYKKVLGPEDVTTATSLNNLASLLKDRGKYADALPLVKCALAIYENVLGPDNPDTALTLHNLASLFQAQGEYAEAWPLYERALAVSESALGSEHTATNRVRRKFASLLLASGNPEEALTLGEAALAGHEKVLGQAHPWAKDSAAVTANALEALGRANEALALRARHGLAGDTRPPPWHPLPGMEREECPVTSALDSC
jgi:tetratricopeptide (TPR) repeat protein